jgi:DnaK suppressor protein
LSTVKHKSAKARTKKPASRKAASDAKTRKAAPPRKTKKPARRPATATSALQKATRTSTSPPTVPASLESPALDPATSYRPAESEQFMGPQMLEYFRVKLETWKQEILRAARESAKTLHLDPDDLADDVDRANAVEARNLGLRAQERQNNLLRKIDAALARIDDGSYGYCEVTGEPIALRRLEARPIATMSVEAQARHERKERLFADGFAR